MTHTRSKSLLVMAAASLLTLVAACGGSGNGVTNGPSSQNENAAAAVDGPVNDGKPITIQVFQSSAGITDSEFEELFVKPVKSKFPNVTLQMVRESGKSIPNLITAGEFPDIIFTPTLNILKFVDAQLTLDHSEIAKKYKVDLGQFDKNAIDVVKLYSDKGELLALPFRINFSVLYYNKSIFDKAAIPYPKDGITWEEVIELGRRIAKSSPDIVAVDPNSMRLTAQNLLVPFVDPKTEKADLNSEKWKYVFDLYKSILEIPDNKSAKRGVAGFEKDQTVAMYTSSGGRLEEIESLAKQGVALDWDMVTYPVPKNAAAKDIVTMAHVLAVSSTAKNKDDAFKIVSYLATDRDVQTKLAKGGFISALKDDSLKKHFGENFKTLQGKNIQAVFKSQYGTMAKPTRYDDVVVKAIDNAEKTMRANVGKDVNSIIRGAQEEAQRLIEAEKAAKK
ncbi:hypothetical protein PAESOLCIP111_03869 [Paenibacillus solanacearum]|uniref:Extracellular solute-binding protein n=1 Tax=Paenibacillus solanacearum TaxID=2048548 RepID=A0A916K678_9BACL|nr:extracellular solute-binding protein [Paenibacillus solanacearum]CAG7637694.1 hypothetical protein PAESOLCIP111_03869 [Paenibacillus solanacearum]